LSTDLKTSDRFQTDEINDKSFSLESLVQALESVNSAPGLEQIYYWLEKAEISADDLQPYLGFKEGNYWRHRVCRKRVCRDAGVVLASGPTNPHS